MSNTLTALAPTLFSVAGEVAAEPAGILDAIDLRINPVAYGDSVTIPVAPTASAATYTPAMTTTAGTDKTATSVTISHTANQMVSWHLTGEEVISLQNGDTNRVEWARQLVGQGMRALRNAASAAALVAAKQGASRATGTAATAPFASDLSALTAARKILRDNGSPMSDLQCVVDSAAYLNLTNLGIIQQTGMAGSDAERRSGIVGRQFGFQLREDGNFALHTIGSNSGRQFSATEPIGETSLAYDTGSGTFTAGDVLTFGSGGGSGTADTNKYVVSAANSATPLVLNGPGLRLQHVDNDVMTTTATFTPNLAFERNAVVGFVRAPNIPANPSITQIPISDTKTGLTFLMCEIVGDGMVTWRLHLMYGFKAIQSEQIALILG
jgi:hypothetical protein